MEAWKISDTGVLRKDNPNEDTCFLEMTYDDAFLAAVCDGMGGANAGEVASNLAAETFKNAFLRQYKENGGLNIRKSMSESVIAANREVFNAAMDDTELMGMGTTIVAAFIPDNGNAVLMNVGDSRAYHITEDGISQITSDHSLVNEMLRRGEITKSEAIRHPQRNIITRAVGVDAEVRCDTYSCTVNKGEYILLCSDGLTDQVSDPEIYYEVYESGHPEKACQSLVTVANSRGGTDNITIILIKI